LKEFKKNEQEIERIEINKNTGNFFYTGTLTDLDNGWVRINTVKGEITTFRKEQIMQRQTSNGDTKWQR